MVGAEGLEPPTLAL